MVYSNRSRTSRLGVIRAAPSTSARAKKQILISYTLSQLLQSFCDIRSRFHERPIHGRTAIIASLRLRGA
jgi:hypothetical protein